MESEKQRHPNPAVIWLAAIRPRTLSISVTPVVVGTSLAVALGAHMTWLPFIAALACGLLIQVGTNLHNDAADFERGSDQPDRIGPLRVTAAGWVTARQVRRAARPISSPSSCRPELFHPPASFALCRRPMSSFSI